MTRLEEIFGVPMPAQPPPPNGYVKLSIFVTIVALLVSGIAGAYMFSLSRTEGIRLEVKSDMDKLRGEMREGNQEILRELRTLRRVRE
jgi:hypothetical protein